MPRDFGGRVARAVTRRAWRALGLGIALASVSAGAGAAADPITIRSEPIARLAPSGGAATFLGGLRLRSDDPMFGGVSGLLLDGDRALAVTDRGRWLQLSLRRDADGAVTGLRSAEIGRLRAASGAALRGRGADAEALVRDPATGRFWVAFERRHRILGFDQLGTSAVAAVPQLPARRLEGNGGIEALAIDRSGAQFAVAEGPVGRSREITGWRMIRGAAQPFTIPRRGGFSPTDAVFGPDGALYLLERRFGFLSGFRTRLRRFSAASIARIAAEPDSAVDLGEGETLFTLGATSARDNFEGLAVEEGPTGDLIATLIADDNFRAAQRTTLVQFRIRAAEPPS